MTRALPAHDRQDLLGQGQRAEHVGLEYRPRLIDGDLLDASDQPVAGIVDQNIDRAPRLADLGHRGLDGGLIQEVEVMDAKAVVEAGPQAVIG